MSGDDVGTAASHASRSDVSAARALLERLARLGVEAVFVNSGTDFPPIIEGLAEARAHAAALPRVVLVAHEHVAMGMAHGHYLATGRPAGVIVHTNVGLANAAIGAINAATDRVPMLLMSGRTPTLEAGRFGARTVPIGWGQEMRDQAALVREACKWEYELRFPEQVPALLDRALAIATSTPAGPVYLSLPREVLSGRLPAHLVDGPPTVAPARIAAATDDIATAAGLLVDAERPLIIAQRGAGSQEGFDALARIADDWGIPVCQYWAVATAVSARHAMYVGQDPAPWLAEADVVLVIDSLAPWSPEAHLLHPEARVVQLGPDPLQSRVPVRGFRSDLSITSEVGVALVALDAELARRRARAGQPTAVAARRERVAAAARVVGERVRDAAARGEGEPMSKEWVASCLGRVLEGRDATVLSELGVPLDPLELTRHGSWRQEPHSGGLGWSLPCALGMKLARPDLLVVATMGDGSHVFANPVACHHVARANDLAVLSIVLDNGGYGAVRRSVLELYPDGYTAADADDVPLTGLSGLSDLAAVAVAGGIHAERVERGTDLPCALERVLDVVAGGRSAMLHVMVGE